MLATRGLDVTEEAVALGRLKDCDVLYVADPNISVRATASVGFKGNTPARSCRCSAGAGSST